MRRGMEQFAQRVTVHCHLDGLERDEVTSYIRHRLTIAGASNLDVFAPDAIEAVHDYSRGIPRVINILCDTALVYGFADEMMPITRSLVETIVKEKKDSGIFFQPSDKGHIPAVDGAAENVDPGALDSKIRHIEGKVRFLENTISSMDQRLTSLQKRKTEKDDIVLELFKMLKNSMESRMRLILKMIQISHRKRIKPEETAEEASPKRSSFFSRRKGNP
jgi:general secretion pathway protein A